MSLHSHVHDRFALYPWEIIRAIPCYQASSVGFEILRAAQSCDERIIVHLCPPLSMEISLQQQEEPQFVPPAGWLPQFLFAVARVLQAVAWPLAVLIICYWLVSPVTQILRSIKSFSYAGAELELALNESLEESQRLTLSDLSGQELLHFYNDYVIRDRNSAKCTSPRDPYPKFIAAGLIDFTETSCPSGHPDDEVGTLEPTLQGYSLRAPLEVYLMKSLANITDQ